MPWRLLSKQPIVYSLFYLSIRTIRSPRRSSVCQLHTGNNSPECIHREVLILLGRPVSIRLRGDCVCAL